jgi:hypothetical protein
MVLLFRVYEMSSREKREQKIRDNRANVSLEDFEALINIYGYIREGGKHPQAVIGKVFMTYKRTNPVGTAYVIELLGMIDNAYPGYRRPS